MSSVMREREGMRMERGIRRGKSKAGKRKVGEGWKEVGAAYGAAGCMQWAMGCTRRAAREVRVVDDAC